MPITTELQHLKIPLPNRGLFTAGPGLFIDKRYSPIMDNVRIHAGEVLNRPGTVFLPAPAQTLDNIPLGGGLQQTIDGAIYSVLGTQTKWYYFNTGTALWTDQTTGTPFTGGDGDLWSFAVVHGKLIGSNGVSADRSFEWTDDATGNLVQLAAASAGRYVDAFADRIFLAHVSESGATIVDRVRWSASGSASHDVWNPATDATAGFIDLVDTPGAITGTSPMFGQYYVFKRDYIHRITETGMTTPSFTVQTVVDGIGCVEGRTIVEIGGMLYFLGREDIYRWDTAGRPEPIGTAIRNEVFDTLDRDSIRTCIAFHHELFNEYWLCIPSSGASWPDTAYIFNYVEGSWSKAMFEATCHTRFKTVDVSPTIDSLTDPINSYVLPFDSSLSGADILFPVIGRIDKKPVQIDDTGIADADSTTPTLSFSSADTLFGPAEKNAVGTCNRVILTVRGRSAATIALELSTDGGQSFTSLGTRATTSDNSLQRLFFPCRVSGQQGRVRLTTTDPIALQGIAYEVYLRAEAR